VDRNVLRLGAFELIFRTETPPAVVINEAVELARRYGTKDSPAFVNGVLDRIHHGREQAAGSGQPAEVTAAMDPPADAEPNG
jgi:N utilization substance protein B